MPKLFKRPQKGILHLPIKNIVYVPSTTAKDKKISKAALQTRVNNTRKFLSKKFGGFTSVKATGGFVLKNGKLVKEKVVKVTAFADKAGFRKNRKPVVNQVRKWGKAWGQESVSYEHEGDLYIIEPNKKRAKKIKKVKK